MILTYCAWCIHRDGENCTDPANPVYRRICGPVCSGALRCEARGGAVSRRRTGGADLNTWNYRVILKNGRYTIHEVYYDEEGEPWTCTEDPVCPEGDTFDDFRAEMEHYQSALELPVLKYTDLVPNHEPPEPDVEQPY